MPHPNTRHGAAPQPVAAGAAAKPNFADDKTPNDEAPNDKATLQILANRCRAAAESMAYTLYRTAHSTFVKETQDFTSGLVTPEGKMFAVPMDLGATWFVGLDYGNAIGALGDYEEGDVCMTNDPYSGFVATHSPDIHLWRPVFYEGRLVCFAVGHIHNTDMGGAVPASLSRTLTEVFQEGIRLPPVKLYKAGVLNEEVLGVMMTNVRVPEQNWGDLKAQVASMHTGARKVREIVDKTGLAEFKEGVQGLLNYAEAQARAIISATPDGAYFFSDYVDEDSVGGPPCRIALTMNVRGDEIVFDFTGTDPQLASSMNIPTGGDERHTLLLVGIFHAFYTLDPNLIMNSGITRPIRCVLPEGTLVNPQFPAAVGMRSLTVIRLQDVVLGCLCQALPDRMPAAPSGSISILNVATTDNRSGKRIMAAIEPLVGGGGGIPFADGPNGAGGNASFLANTPVEINESEVPIKIMRYELTPDSGGAGTHRGGLSTTLEFQLFSPQAVVTARNRDRTIFQSWGVLGGRAGLPSEFIRNPGSAKEIDLGNTDILNIDPGDVIRITSSGSGGWGNPLERPPQQVLADVRKRFVSLRSAESDYGVMISDDAVDVQATIDLRERMQDRATVGHFDYGPYRDRFERIWTGENYAALTEILAGLPVHWRFFVKKKLFEAMGSADEGGERLGRSAAAEDVRTHFEAVLREYPMIREPVGAER